MPSKPKPIKRTGASGDIPIPHTLLFPGSTSIYPEGAPCPGHAQVPAGLSRTELASDGKGGWIKRSAGGAGNG